MGAQQCWSVAVAKFREMRKGWNPGLAGLWGATQFDKADPNPHGSRNPAGEGSAVVSLPTSSMTAEND